MGDLRNDIEKYLRGELSPADRHALEKRALNDPFLADALAGAESISMEDFSADLKSLQHSVSQRIKRNEEKKVIPVWSWTMRIAAGLLIVAVAGFAVYQLTHKRNNVEIAQTGPKEEAPAPKTTEGISTDSTTENSNGNKPAVGESSAVVEKPTPVPAEKPKSARRDGDLALARELQPSSGVSVQRAMDEKEERRTEVPAVSSQPVIAQEAEKDDAVVSSYHFTQPDTSASADVKLESLERARDFRIAGNESQGIFNKAKKEGVPGASPAVVIRSRETGDVATADNKVIRGKVVSADDGEGLPGVNITIKGTDVGTITDAEGNYQIAVEPAVSGLVFSFIGMESQEITLQDATQVNVAMNQDMTQLSEVVVTGYGLEPEDDIKGRITFATPSGGRTAFKKYIESSMQYPEQALVNKVEGRVTIQFTVETTGELSNIKVVKGIGYGCDEEVIRLITQGPKWNPTRKDDDPIPGKIKVRVRFKLPKK
jgi:TonB family protein